MIASDILRAYIINEWGGIYLDLDYEILTKIHWLVDSTDFFSSVWDISWIGNLNPNIFGAKPKHPILSNIV